MNRTRARRIGMGSLVIVLLIGLAVAQALRDTTPPALWLENPQRAAAGEPFDVTVTADEPVTYRVTYGAETVERVEQNLNLTLTAVAGEEPIRVVATDASGNESEATGVLEGVVVPHPELMVPGELRPGDPFSVVLRFSPADAPRDEVVIEGGPGADAAPIHALPMGDGVYTLGAVPLGTEPGPFRIEARWRDGLDRDAVVAAKATVVPLGQEIEELNISAATLSVITPEGRALEAEALAAARVDPNDPPLWTEPFVSPIDGRGTSGFGSPRRYAPGGPVSFHLGEDIAAPTGTPIRATNAGVVVLADMYPIKGGLTIIDHGAGVTSRYYHQSSIGVEAGQRIERGAVIGKVGSTGLSTGPHLHWEMRVDDVPSYPVAWLDVLRP